MIRSSTFRATGKVDLSQHDPDFTGDYRKDTAEQVLEALKADLAVLQEHFYATAGKALLLVFQAMDGGGKDSVIEHVMGGLNPQGCEVTSFKQPSSEESTHDFLWRHARALPRKGMIGIHNRSHYENVLILRVHPNLLNLRGKLGDKFWQTRYESIRDFEKHLTRNDTVILKFFLHISKDEQKERFLARLEDPAKHFKFAAADLDEREYWDDYMEAYARALEASSTDEAPWYIIPGNKKWFARIAVATLLKNKLEEVCAEMPVHERFSEKDVQGFRKRLSAS